MGGQLLAQNDRGKKVCSLRARKKRRARCKSLPRDRFELKVARPRAPCLDTAFVLCAVSSGPRTVRQKQRDRLKDDTLAPLLLQGASAGDRLTYAGIAQLASAAVDGGYAGKTSRRLASFGGKRRFWSSNAERAAHIFQRQKMRRHFGLGKFDYIPLTPFDVPVEMAPLLLRKQGKVTLADFVKQRSVQEPVPFLLPWDQLACAHQAKVFDRAMFGSNQSPRDLYHAFWGDFLQAPWGRAENHPLSTTPTSLLRKTVPISLHFDGVQIEKASGAPSEWVVIPLSSCLTYTYI